MAVKRFQNKVAGSKFALPLTAVYALLVWLAGGLTGDHHLWVPFVCMAVSAYLMVELNNSYALIRIYSRMVSCSFLVLTAMAVTGFADVQGSIVQLCMVAFYLIFFRTYQDKAASGWTFYAFFCLGMAALVFIQAVFFVPFLWFIMSKHMMSLSWRTFWASVIGVLTPFWFAGAYYLLTGQPEALLAHIVPIAQFQPLLQYDDLGLNRLLTLAFVVIVAATGCIHFWRNSFFDKIRTRMIYHVLIIVGALSLVFLVLQPCHFDTLLKLLTISTSVLIAHFIALTRTRLTNIAFVVMLVATLLITLLNLWQPSLTF